MLSRHEDAVPGRRLRWVVVMAGLILGPGCKDEPSPGVQMVAKREVEGTPQPRAELKAQPEENETSSADDEQTDDPPPEGITTHNLKRFIPEEVRGSPRQLVGEEALGNQPEQVFVAASYELMDDRGRRFVNINLKKVQDLEFEKAQFRVKDGEERQVQTSALLGKKIDGRLVQRSYSHGTESSEVIVLVEDAISVRVSVEKAKDPDEPFEILALIDLDGLASIVE